MEDRLFLQPLTPNVFQEDISKLRRKIEKAKKPAEKISNGDEILNEEINDYKVCFGDRKNVKNVLFSMILLQTRQQFLPVSGVYAKLTGYNFIFTLKTWEFCSSSHLTCFKEIDVVLGMRAFNKDPFP